MISTLEKEIAFRYLKTKKKDGFLNVISIFSFIGISLGVAVLIIVMSVMNGFRSELINKIVGFNSHITIQPYDISIDKSKLNNKDLKSISNKMIFSSKGEAMIIHKDYTKGILLRGYSRKDFMKLDLANNDNFISKTNNLIENNISVGKDLSDSLNLKIGSKIMIMSSSGVQTIIGNLPKQKTFIVNSIFDSGLSDFDQNIAFINIDMQAIFGGIDVCSLTVPFLDAFYMHMMVLPIFLAILLLAAFTAICIKKTRSLCRKHTK